METISQEFIETYGIKGFEPSFSIIEELGKLGRGIVFQGCDGYGFVGLTFDGVTHCAVYILDYNKPALTLTPIETLDEFFITEILPKL
jgi:hypothetical protein